MTATAKATTHDSTSANNAVLATAINTTAAERNRSTPTIISNASTHSNSARELFPTTSVADKPARRVPVVVAMDSDSDDDSSSDDNDNGSDDNDSSSNYDGGSASKQSSLLFFGNRSSRKGANSDNSHESSGSRKKEKLTK